MPRTRVDIRFISYVIAAADNGSFRQAALALGVQESAVSRRIRNLEAELGADLFTRSASGVQLTKAGRQFVERSRQAIAEIGLAGAEVGAMGQGDAGELKIGILAFLGSAFLSELIREFGAKYPSVRMNFVGGDQPGHVATIRQLKLDIAFVFGNAKCPECSVEPLWSERIFVALPASHRLNTGAAVGWKDLVDERFIVTDAPPGLDLHDFLIKRLASPGHHPQIEHHEVEHLNLLSLVALGRGLTLACEGITNIDFPGVVFRPLEDEHIVFSAIWSPENDNPVFQRFLELGCAMAAAFKKS